jgi:hypothetical protein
MKRNRRAGVDDLWTKTVRDPDGNTRTVPSARDGRGMRWRARYVDGQGREHTKAFTRKVDAQGWLDNEITPTAYPAATRPGLANHAGLIYLAFHLVELWGIEPPPLPAEMRPELPFRSVPVRFDPIHYLRFRSRVLTASRAVSLGQSPTG